MHDIDIQPLVAATFRSLADALTSGATDLADAASLCEGWSVRSVVAHMTMAARYSPEEFAAELRRDDFDFDRLSNRIAARDGARPFDTLVEHLRSDAMARWAPPQGGYAGALTHVVIHGLDITVPLGLHRSASDDAMRNVLDNLTMGEVHRNFGTNIDDLRLQAVDFDWTYGSGRTVVAGQSQDIALTLCGRRIPSLDLGPAT